MRPATVADQDGIWKIIQPIISKGESYVFDPTSSRQKMLDVWFNLSVKTYVAERDSNIVGTFILKDNQPDLGSHVANAAFMTSPLETGTGIGKFMGEYALEEARRQGYKSMQFNLVVKSNEVAVRLWQKLGFMIIGEVPDAFNHPLNGYTNAYIMYRKL